MNYRTTSRADQDIIDIYVHGAEHFGIDQSERYLSALFDTFELIARNPRMARERRELKPPMRFHPFQAHMIVYTVGSDHVLIVRVLHGRQDWQSLFA